MDQLRDTVNYWMNNDPFPSWRHLVDALRAPSVGEKQLAEEIEAKYCGPEEQSSCDESVASVQTKYYQGNIACMYALTTWTLHVFISLVSTIGLYVSLKHMKLCCVLPMLITRYE